MLSASALMKVAVTDVWSPLAAELPGVLPHLGQVAAEVAYQALPQMAMVGVLSWPLLEVALPVAPALRQALGRTAAPAARALPAKAVQADVAAVVTVAADRACRTSCLAWLDPGS